jgi:ribosomal protein S18 acetylase RimI-like enzyme
VTTGSPHIRQARPADAPAMARIHVATWRSDYRGFAPDDYLASLSEEGERHIYEGLIEGPQSMAFVAEDDMGRVVGLSTCGPYRDEGSVLNGEFTAELYNLYVAADARKSGVGRGLVRAAATALRSRGITSMMLWTFEAYASNTFYPRLGGKIVGRRKAMIGAKQVSDLAFGWQDIGIILL